MKRTIDRITSTAMLAVAFMLCATSAWAETTTSITAPAAWGGTKPKAVWLGDFPATGNDSTRNGYTLNLNGNATTDGIVTIGGSSSTGGVTVKTTTGKTAVGVVAGIKGVATSSAIRILMSSYQTDGNDNRTMVGFQANESKFSGFTSGPAYFNSNNISWTSNANTNYFAFSYQGASGTGRGTYAYLNGSDTIYNNAGTLAYSDASVLGVTFGGAHNAKNYNMDGAVISYAAVLDATSATDLSPALKFWSLTDISSIEVHKTTGTIDGGSGRGITLNLNGETVTVSGVKTAAAVFVQDDTTLDFSGDATSRLDISGPLYVADSKTLTIKLGMLSDGYRKPITMGSCFAGNNQIQLQYTTPDGSVTSIIPTAVSITAFTQTEDEQAAQAAVTIRDYTQWSYATDVFTWISPSSASGSDVALWKYIKFDVSTGQTAVGATAIEGGNSTAYDAAATPSKKFWWYWCYSGSSDFPGYSTPGLVARFVPDTNEITHLKAIPAGFGPLTIGGLIVENGATGYSFEADDSSKVRWTTLGDPTGQVETRFTILEDFAINRNGSLNLVGTSNFDIATGKVLSLNAGRADGQQPVIRAAVGAAADNGEITSGIVDGGCLKLHGEGQISATKLTASSACLDYSYLSASRAVPYIDAQLVVDSNTSYKFPALSGAATYQLAHRLADTSGVTGEQTFSIGGHEYQAPLAFNESNGTVVFPAVATLAGSETAVNWSDISWDAKPATIGSSDVVTLNVTGNTTLDVAAEASVKKLVLNISNDVTLTLANAGNLTTGSDGIVIRGTGTLKISGAVSVPALTVEDNATILYDTGSTSLTVTGAITVTAEKTLNLTLAQLSGASATYLSAGYISGNVNPTRPTEDGYSYSILVAGSSYKLVRTPNVAFYYNGTIGATPSGWFSDVGEAFSSNLRVGPNSSWPLVYEATASEHPYNTAVSWTDKNITFALYADISQVANTGKPVLVCVGGSGADNRDFLVLYRDGDKVRLAVWNTGVYDSTASFMVGTAAYVDVPTSGYHLYTATFNSTTGGLTLYRDNVAGTAGSADRAVSLPAGFQIGNVYMGSDNGSYSHLSGTHGLAKGIGMAFAAIRGYDAVLEADNVAKLCETFPATANSYTHTVDLNASGKTLTVYSTTFTGSCYLGVSNGALVIPENNTVSVPHVRVQNQSTGSVTIDVYGTLNVTSESDDPNLAWKDGGGADYLSYKGILLGRTGSGTGTLSIHENGVVDGSGTWLQTVAGATGAQTITIDGGTLKIKGFYSDKADKSTINLQNGGCFEISGTTDRGQSITYNLGYGTVKAKSSITLSSGNKFATSFSGNISEPTTLDPCGNTLTMSDGSLSGSGYVTVASSAESETKGSVVFGANASFGGKVILTDANRDLIDISAYKGGILYSGTEADTLAKLNGFGGTVYFTSNVDASSIDLSGATVNLAENCTLTALVGNEGKLVLDSGAVVTLKVTNDIVNYEGHVPVVSGVGTVVYYNTEESEAVNGDDHVNGNNLLPYYQIWEVNEGVGSGNVSTPSNWKGNAVPGTGKNVAFHVTGDSQITVTVDSTITFGEVQVYGEGTVLFEKSGENTLICNTAFHVTDGTAVRIIDGSVYVMGAAGFKIADGSKVVYAVSDKSTEYNFMTKVSGAGSFWLDGGVVTFNTATGLAELTGGLRVLAGTIAKTTANDGNASGFGPQDSSITVETGAQLDLGNTANICYSITIDPGVEDSELPVLTCSTTIDQNSKQMSALTVNADAIIDVPATKEFGLVASSYATAPVAIKKGVTLTKKGGGKFLMASAQISNIANGDITVAPKLVIEEGSVEVANGYGGGASACTLADGATFDVEVSDDADFVVKKGFAATSLIVAGAGTVNVASSGALTLTSVSGAGTVKWTGKQPDGNKWNTCSGWTGTNIVSNASGQESMNPANWGNTYSYIKMSGVAGYFTNSDITVPATTIFENLGETSALNVSNGYQGKSVTFETIVGDGTIEDGHSHTTAWHMLIFKNADKFRGSIKQTQTNGCKKFVFSRGGTGTSSASGNEGMLVVQTDGVAYIGAGKEWKPKNNIIIKGLVTLEGAATMSRPVIASDSAKIVLVDTPLTISSTLTATALEIDPGEIELSPSEPTVLITGLTNTEAPDVSGIVVLGCTVSVGGTSGAYTIQATIKSTSWTGESGTWSASSFNGGDLTTEGQDIAFLPATSDAVTVTLNGTRAPANVLFKGGATGYTLKGGTFAPSGTVTIESGAVTIESEATGTYVVKSGATLSLTNATVTSVSGAGTLNIPTGGVVTLASVSALDSLSYITGSGELRVGANIPGATLNTLLKKSYTEDEETKYWHGTVVIEGFTQTDDGSVGGTTLDCGNASSTIKVKSSTIRYFDSTDTDATLEIDTSLTTLNGSSGATARFGSLKGSGSFTSTVNDTVTHLYRFTRDSMEFTGSLNVKGRRFVFGPDGDAGDASDKTDFKGTIRISSGVSVSIGANACWKADNGVVVNGKLLVKGSGASLDYYQASPTQGIKFGNGAILQYDSLSTLKLGGETLRTPTVASGDTVKIAFGEDVDLTSGTKLISWGGAPQGSFAFDDGAGGSTPNKVVDGVRYVLVSESDGLYLKARYGTIFSVW